MSALAGRPRTKSTGVPATVVPEQQEPARAPAGRRPQLVWARSSLVSVIDADVLVRTTDRPVRHRPATQLVATAAPVPAAMSGLRVPCRLSYFHPFFDRGDTGYLAVQDGTVVGWIWLSRVTHRDPASGHTIRLASDEAYAYALWTAPEARALGSGQLLVSTMLQAVRDDPGLSRVYGYVDKHNRESQLLLRMLGFRDVQTARRLQVVRRGWVLPRSDVPCFGPFSRTGRHSASDQ